MNHETVSLYIDIFEPNTLPMSRLAEYLKSFATMLGSEDSVHFMKVGEGSADCIAAVELSASPKVKDRLESIAAGTAPKSAMEAHLRIDDLLLSDNAIGYVKMDGRNVIEFPGRRRAAREVIGPVQRNSSIEGQIFGIGGKDDTINVYLRDGNREVKCVVSITLARSLGPHLRRGKLRLFGSGFWARVDGEWIMKSFTAESFIELDDSPIESALASIRKNFEGLDPEEFVSTMLEVRRG